MTPSRREFLKAAAVAGAATAVVAGHGEMVMAQDTERFVSNDTMALTPRTTFPAETRRLEFDFPALQIGCAEYDQGPTGCTVFHFTRRATCVADVRGGSHASINMDYLLDGAGSLDAICFAGGSMFGLEATTGVTAELLARNDHKVAWTSLPLVSGAIIYDFRPRPHNSIYPDKSLGRAALAAATTGSFPLGPRGAGRSATCGKGWSDTYKVQPAGQGGAFAQLGPAKLALFTVVNAMGSIVDRHGNVVRGTYDPETKTHKHPRDLLPPLTPPPAPERTPGENTTLTLLVTNVSMSPWKLRQFARQSHSAMSRCIHPFHALYDGDIFFAATTNDIRPDDPASPSFDHLAFAASDLAWDAVLACYDPD